MMMFRQWLAPLYRAVAKLDLTNWSRLKTFTIFLCRIRCGCADERTAETVDFFPDICGLAARMRTSPERTCSISAVICHARAQNPQIFRVDGKRGVSSTPETSANCGIRVRYWMGSSRYVPDRYADGCLCAIPARAGIIEMKIVEILQTDDLSNSASVSSIPETVFTGYRRQRHALCQSRHPSVRDCLRHRATFTSKVDSCAVAAGDIFHQHAILVLLHQWRCGWTARSKKDLAQRRARRKVAGMNNQKFRLQTVSEPQFPQTI